MSRTVIVTPFANSRQLAAACVLSGLSGDVVPVGEFSAIFYSSATQSAQEFPDVESAYLPEADKTSSLAHRTAQRISKLAGEYEVLILSYDESHISAAHYRAGLHKGEVAAGLALSNLPDDVEALLLGAKQPEEIDGLIRTADMSKLQASAITMTPQRAAVAKRALRWICVVVSALVVLGVGLVVLLNGHTFAWIAVGLGVIALSVGGVRSIQLLRFRSSERNPA